MVESSLKSNKVSGTAEYTFRNLATCYKEENNKAVDNKTECNRFECNGSDIKKAEITKIEIKDKIISKLLFLLFLFLILFAEQISAQEQSNTSEVERQMEIILEQLESDDSDADHSELLELIQDLLSHPLDLNHASIDELLQIPNLTHRITQNIINHRSEHGLFDSVENLLDVSGIGPVTFERIRPYITVTTEKTRGLNRFFSQGPWTQNSRFESYSRFRRVLQEQNGTARPDSLGGYRGAPFSYYQRLHYRSRHLSMNLTQDKDSGEAFTFPSGFDHSTLHFSIQNREGLQALIIGDYSVSFGQGLLLWSGGSFGKSSNSIGGLIKNERGVRPYTSAQESGGFRGVALTVGEQLQFTGFYSDRKRTASEMDDNSVNFPTASGLHRTSNEYNRRNNLGQETYGGRIRALFKTGTIGISAFHNRFDKNIATGTNPYQRGLFSGQERSGYSADFRLQLDRVQFFGEVAYTDNGGYGWIAGATYQADSRTDIAVSYRFYDPFLQSIFGSGFGEQSGIPRNEIGYYLGLKHSLNSQFQIYSYIDYFRFPSPRFQTTQPTSGLDSLFRIEFQPNRSLNVYTLFRLKIKEQEVKEFDLFGREYRILEDHIRSNIRFHTEYQLSQNLRLRFRFDLIRTQTATGDIFWGTLLYKDFRFRPLQNFRIDARITLFDADDFESRVYQFENDLLYVLSNTMLFNRGQRIYMLLHYRPIHFFEIWLKVATTVYENRYVIGSGLNQIIGKRKSDIGIQIRLRF